jgi:heme exporter protein B
MNELSLTRALRALVMRDLLLALRRKGDLFTVLLFFVVVLSLFPLGVGADNELLRRIGPGVIWVAALLASMLGLARLFAADHADGTLEQLLLSPQPLTALALAKTTAHWLSTGLPLVFVSPLLGLQYDLDAPSLCTLVIALLLGTPVLSLLGAVGAALTLGLRGGGALLSLLVLPLYVPVLVFGAAAVDATAAGLDATPQLSLLGAFLLFSAVFAPWATAAALRIANE